LSVQYLAALVFFIAELIAVIDPVVETGCHETSRQGYHGAA